MTATDLRANSSAPDAESPPPHPARRIWSVIMHGYGAERVLAVAADMHDDKQRQREIARVERQFGRNDAMFCARD